MEMTCQKCGTPASNDQAFCSKCGAVLGMSDAGGSQHEAPPNLAATVVGKFPFPPPPSRPPANQPPAPQAAQAPRAPAAAAPAPPRASAPPSVPVASAPVAPPSRSSATLLVIIGFVAVLLIGALLIYLFLFNLQP